MGEGGLDSPGSEASSIVSSQWLSLKESKKRKEKKWALQRKNEKKKACGEELCLCNWRRWGQTKSKKLDSKNLGEVWVISRSETQTLTHREVRWEPTGSQMKKRKILQMKCLRWVSMRRASFLKIALLKNCTNTGFRNRAIGNWQVAIDNWNNMPPGPEIGVIPEGG